MTDEVHPAVRQASHVTVVFAVQIPRGELAITCNIDLMASRKSQVQVAVLIGAGLTAPRSRDIEQRTQTDGHVSRIERPSRQCKADKIGYRYRLCHCLRGSCRDA
ncbi:hypothetical protein MNVI_00240 [Mycobacterium noviomagense]|uniref:Uncharacterized protein n=1 Tax=Mycobacterium noviomagense TaxID=459858 RepID=A0A7I7P736_9MYCO|nr:hypothetical protein MNVI_00240 [Mycobacterium noviomagense]